VPAWWGCPLSALGRVVHLIPAGEVFPKDYGSMPVAVRGKSVTSGSDGEEDPSYCLDCVRAALRWCAWPLVR
jgi:hypothetical protein